MPLVPQSAPRGWQPPAGTLGRILADVAARIPELLARSAELERAAASAPPAPPFAAALAGRTVAIIAEAKRRSPSRGTLNAALDVGTQLAAYERGGAAAGSVLTEPRHFGGAASDLAAARAAARLPLLRKDFVVHPLQMTESRAAGASAVLLIARALAPGMLRVLCEGARGAGLEVLVETRTEGELEAALEARAHMIGVNARDLETLQVDAGVIEGLLPRIPAECVAVWESGVTGAADVRRAADVGADAVLVGSLLSAASDPAAAVRALCGVPRGGRRG